MITISPSYRNSDFLKFIIFENFYKNRNQANTIKNYLGLLENQITISLQDFCNINNTDFSIFDL